MNRAEALALIAQHAPALVFYSTPERARGHCYLVSLWAAITSSADPPSLVRFCLDPRKKQPHEFPDHWVLPLDDGSYLDLTAAQVDGDPLPIRTVYPSHFGVGEILPLAPLVTPEIRKAMLAIACPLSLWFDPKPAVLLRADVRFKRAWKLLRWLRVRRAGILWPLLRWAV